MPYPIFALSPLPISCTDYRLYFAAGMGAAEEPLVENTSMPEKINPPSKKVLKVPGRPKILATK
jgi:hypothetical protein